MAKRAETLRKPQSGWGRASHIARRSVLAISLVAGASILQGEPLEADTARANQLTPVATERGSIAATNSQTTSRPAQSMSVSAFSAAQSDTARVLLAQELGGESNRAVGIPSVAATPEATAAPHRGEAEARQIEAAEARAEEETAIVGRSLRAFTRNEEEDDSSSSTRRRASFSSAISRAAAAGALTSTNPNASVGSALNSARFTPPTNSGQFDPGFSQAAEVISIVPGLRLESATLFGGYSSNSLPRGLVGGTTSLRGAQLGADYDLGASAVISYNHNGRRSLTQFSYAPSHVQRSRIPEWSTTDHRFSFRSSRDLTPRLSLSGTANAGNSGIEQFWMRPSVIRRVEAPASFNELMQRVMAGEISDDEFAAILTGSPVVDDPGGAERDLDRIFSMSTGASASYSYSRRLTFNFGGRTSANRLLGDILDNPRRSRSPRYLNFARTSSANFSADYRLSSRTQIGLSHATTFTNSTFARSVSQSPTVSLNQMLSRHWSYQVGVGIGTINFDEVSTQGTLTDRVTWTANGSLGYTSGAHSINVSTGKQVGDPMGFGSRSTVHANLMWAWQPRFSPWGANAGIAFSRSDLGVAGQYGRDFSSDLYSAGFSRRLTPSTSFRSDYYYGAYVSPYSGVASNMAVHRMQMSLMWRPVEQR